MTTPKMQEALSYFRAGDKKSAEKILLEIVQSEPDNTDAWFGLALCASDNETKRSCLERVLARNPNNEKARQMLEKLPPAEPIPAPIPEPVHMAARSEADQVDADDEKPEPTRPTRQVNIYAIVSSLLIFTLFCVCAWLWYRLDQLEKQVHADVARLASADETLRVNDKTLASNIDALDRQTHSNLTTLASAIDSLSSDLSYVSSLASNANQYAHSHNTYSDINLKTAVVPIPNVLEKVLTLRGVQYRWNATALQKLVGQLV